MFENIWFNPEVIPGMAATLRRADDFFRYTETVSFTRVGMLGKLLILISFSSFQLYRLTNNPHVSTDGQRPAVLSSAGRWATAWKVVWP